MSKKLKERAVGIINYEKKEISLMKSKKNAIYVKKSFVRMKMMKIIKAEKRLRITAIIQENVEQLLIASVI